MPGDFVTAPAADARSPGFFGKLPSRGDFVTRRLPQAFVGRWDAWLQEALAASRAGLGSRWLDIYLTSPVWRFALAPGVCGPRGWLGVMIPSVDKVGRYFPLAAAHAVGALPLAAVAKLEDWFASIEALLLATLADMPLELEQFDERLASLALPGIGGADYGIDARGGTLWHWPAPAGRLAATLERLGAEGHSSAGWQSVWWTQGSERIDPCVLTAADLPAPHAFGAMLDGAWSERGWGRGTLESCSKHGPPAGRAARGAWCVRSAGVTHAGKTRRINEDSWACRDDVGAWLVADGLGGHQAGELASPMVAAALEAVDGRACAEQIVHGLHVVNRCLRVLAARSDNIALAASTVAALVVDGDGCACIWAGDSRIYRLRAGRLEQLSDDHSAAANGARDARAVTRAIGGGDVLELGVARHDVRAGDRFLLCTDGLYAEVDAAAVIAALSLPEPALGCAALRDAALAGDAPDNLTAVVVHVEVHADIESSLSRSSGRQWKTMS